ncbi:DUF6461 domain-containing protein [Catellatospora citrea]|nr:DUF6461 domain-containing protein [Catellatospora citrea]RKE10697.1 hypothetical protein C8E86_5613 [Catellatospora citrea]
MESLVSENGAFALVHRGGVLALRDRSRAVDLWQVCGSEAADRWDDVPGQLSAAFAGTAFVAMTSHAATARLTTGSVNPDVGWVGVGRNGMGRLVLLPDGYLVLEDGSGRPHWRSGGVDRRVSAAIVTGDGRLVLMDPDGFQRWSRDPVTDADFAGYQVATGDRLTRGQRLAGAIMSSNGRYRLSHKPDGETVLVRVQGGGEVWSRRAGAPGLEITLGHDGVLRTGTDSTALARWTGRRVDPLAFVVSALVVEDDGDVVLVGADGSEVYRSGTAVEEARLGQLQREYVRREHKERAKHPRPRGSGLGADWFRALDLGDHYAITLVQAVSAHEALLRLGVDAERIASMAYADLALVQDLDGDTLKRFFCAQLDDWVMVVELDSTDGADRLTSMSRGTQAVVCALNHDGEEFLGWSVDGVPTALYEWDSESEALERGGPADAGTRRDAIVPFMRAIGLGRYRDTGDDDHFLPASVEIACLIANVRPGPEHFAAERLGAVDAR